MSSGKFLPQMNTQELENAHELSVKSYTSASNNNSFVGGDSHKNKTPMVKKTKSKVKTSNGKRFFNNPYYAGTPLAALAAAVKKTNNNGTRSGNRSGNTSATKLAARAYKQQLQAYQAAQARLAAEQEKQDQEAVDIIVSAESSVSRGATLGNFAGEQQPLINICSPPQMPSLEPVSGMMMSSKNNSSFLGERQDSSMYNIGNNNNSQNMMMMMMMNQQPQQPSFYRDYNNTNHNNNELENFSFTSQQFIAATVPSQHQQQPQQPQQQSYLAVNHQFNQSVSGFSSSSGAGSEDERHMMQQLQQAQQPEQPSFGFNPLNQNKQQHQQQQQEFVPPQPKSFQQQNQDFNNNNDNMYDDNDNYHNNGKKQKYDANTTFVVVMFKYELCSFQCKFVVCEGDWVVVQADRGEHVGRVHSVSQEAPVFHVPYQILRHANFTEIASIEANHPREAQAGQRIHQIAMDLQLPLQITDTEFYADGNKMTVFFSSKTTVDFRELQRRVFREFRRRIWLINNAEVQYRNRNCRNRK